MVVERERGRRKENCEEFGTASSTAAGLPAMLEADRNAGLADVSFASAASHCAPQVEAVGSPEAAFGMSERMYYSVNL